MDLQEFLDFNGLNLTPIFDGKIHRFNIDGREDKSGWYWGNEFEYAQVFMFGDWADARGRKVWKSKEPRGVNKSELERQITNAIQESNRQREAEYVAKASECENWIASNGASEYNSDFKYFKAKKIDKLYGALSAGGFVIIPARDIRGKVWSAQKIYEDGSKRFYPGGKIAGCFFIIGELSKSMYLCEGFATGVSIHKATGASVVVSFSASNMIKVAGIFYPNGYELKVCADNDSRGEKNVGLDSARYIKAKYGFDYTYPRFNESESKAKCTDFNDLEYSRGLSEVKAQVEYKNEEQNDRSNFSAIEGPLDKDHAKMIREGLKDYESYIQFFNDNWLTKRTKVCAMTNQAYININGNNEPLFNHLSQIKSMAQDWFLQDRKVESHLTRWVSTKKPELLIDIPKWDRVDRLREMLSYVKVNNMSHDCFVDLQMAWLAGVFYRYNNPENQNTMNLWEGAQGIGKDTFFKHLTRGFGLYARELSPDSRLNDLYGDIGSLLIAAMPEFDQFTGISAGALKDLITSPGKSFRSPYERKSQYHQFRCSFYSNANLSDYLRDTTGNRRFWVFEVDSIDHSYPKYTEECSQIVAQIYSLYQDRYQAKSENIKTVSDFVEANRTPEDPGKNIIELWEQRASEFLRGRSSNKMRYSDAVEIVNDMSRLTKANNRFILRILKINGFSREEGHEKLTYYYPKRSEKIYLPE